MRCYCAGVAGMAIPDDNDEGSCRCTLTQFNSIPPPTPPRPPSYCQQLPPVAPRPPLPPPFNAVHRADVMSTFERRSFTDASTLASSESSVWYCATKSGTQRYTSSVSAGDDDGETAPPPVARRNSTRPLPVEEAVALLPTAATATALAATNVGRLQSTASLLLNRSEIFGVDNR